MKGWDFTSFGSLGEGAPCHNQSALLPGSRPEDWSGCMSACTFLSCICEMGLGQELNGFMHANGTQPGTQ